MPLSPGLEWRHETRRAPARRLYFDDFRAEVGEQPPGKFRPWCRKVNNADPGQGGRGWAALLHCLSNPRGEVPCPFSGPSIAREVYNGAGLVAEAPVRAEAAPGATCFLGRLTLISGSGCAA